MRRDFKTLGLYRVTIVRTIHQTGKLLCELRVELNGAPAGALLAGVELPVPGLGKRFCLRAAFETPAIVSAGRVWVVLAAEGGAVIWMLTPDPDGLLMQRERGLPAWVGPRAGQGFRGTATLLQASAVQGQDAVGTQVLFEGTPLQAAPAGNGKTQYDFAAPLNARLPTANSGGLHSFELSVLSGQAGTMTAYPPEIEYDLAL